MQWGAYPSVLPCTIFHPPPQDLCIACGDMAVVAEHPLFHGALCKECKVNLLTSSKGTLYAEYIVANSLYILKTLLHLSSLPCTLSMQGIFLECTYLFDDDGTQVNHLHYFIVGIHVHVPSHDFNSSMRCLERQGKAT